ncbi:MAG TPA: toxin-antitoxin (TA) system antitoxin [Anaerolineae bacterium]|nr:toxin-antitoxin (TA) system antitoxin [Anaerolineae bacterium]HMR65414.1 toxin-antitoxin (TA) system antitoxin [Anaerolineae bacterium]
MPIKTIEVKQTQADLTELLSLVGKGTEIILTQDDMPVARLIPIETASGRLRVPGLHSGKIWASEDFDDQLPDEFWLGQE